MSTSTFLRRRILDPLIGLLRQGVTPERMAWSLSVGAVLGLFPFLGTTTLLCTVVALWGRLNLVAIQVSNWVVYPLQLLLLIPFYRLGERLLGATPVPLSPQRLVEQFDADFWGSLVGLWTTLLGGMLVWALLALPLAVLLYLALLPLLKRLPALRHLAAPPQEAS